MVNIKLRSKGISIVLNLKKSTVDVDKIANNLKKRGFRISPSVPNMPTAAISTDLKCMLHRNKLEVRVQHIKQLLKSKSKFEDLLNLYTRATKQYLISFDASFLVSGDFDIDKIMKAMYNSKKAAEADLYLKPVGFKVAISENQTPVILSLEGAKESDNVMYTLSFATNDKSSCLHLIDKTENIMKDFFDNVVSFAK